MALDGAPTRTLCESTVLRKTTTQSNCRSYFTDSLENIIYAYDYNEGTISNRRVLIDAKALNLTGFSDGLCIDADGYIWVARWGGSCIVRFSPQGEIDLEIVFPTVLNVTSCCFGGEYTTRVCHRF